MLLRQDITTAAVFRSEIGRSPVMRYYSTTTKKTKFIFITISQNLPSA